MGDFVGKLIQASSIIFLSLLLGAVMLAIVAVEFPGAFGVALEWGAIAEDFVGSSNLDDKYNNWVKFLIAEEQIVFMGFVIIARIILSLIAGGFNRVFGG